MQRLLNLCARYMPLIFVIMVIMMLMQWLGKIDWAHAIKTVLEFFEDYVIYLVAASVIGWLFVIMAVIHHNDRLPKFMQRDWLMDILDRLSNKSDIEQGLESIDQEIYIDAEELATSLKQKVIGQNNVCDDVAAQIRRRLALKSRGKPVGIFLFAGPPGTGKTYLAKNLATALDRNLLHFDMTQFASGSYSISQLFGMPKGYVGSDSYGKMTSGLQDSPDSVILLDEIEKAHPDILKAFLTAWNDGFITERSDGSIISTTSAIFVLTSNAATERLTDLSNMHKDNEDMMRAASIEALRESGFAPEVLNRLDRVFVFRKLEGLDIARVTALEIEKMVEDYGLSVGDRGIDPQIILVLMSRYKKLGRSSSSRDLVRGIEEKMADSLIEAKRRGIEKITLIQKDDGSIKAVAISAE